MAPKLFSVWEGVYESFAEAGGDFDAWESDIWLNKQISRTYEALEAYTTDTFFSKDYPLPMVVSMALIQKSSLSVLDFGGGMGVQYLETIGKVPEAKEKMHYYVVDGLKSIAGRPRALDQFNNLHFFDNLKEVPSSIDIIHIGSTLQYIETWQDFLTGLNDKFKPQYLVFSDLLAGDIPTFVSHQLFYEKRIPHLFLNWPFFKKFVDDMGFSLIFSSQFIHKILNQEDVMPNFSLPEAYRIDRGRHAVFVAQ